MVLNLQATEEQPTTKYSSLYRFLALITTKIQDSITLLSWAANDKQRHIDMMWSWFRWIASATNSISWTKRTHTALSNPDYMHRYHMFKEKRWCGSAAASQTYRLTPSIELMHCTQQKSNGKHDSISWRRYYTPLNQQGRQRTNPSYGTSWLIIRGSHSSTTSYHKPLMRSAPSSPSTPPTPRPQQPSFNAP